MGAFCNYFGRRVFFISLVLVLGIPMSANAYVIGGGGLTEGFDGPGLGSASINYYLGWDGIAGNGLDANVSVGQMETALADAMATWSSVADIGFNYLGNANTTPGLASDPWGSAADPTLVLYFHDDDPGLFLPFDGGPDITSVFAHAWGPDSAGADGAGYEFWGNIHMDSDENWLTAPAADGTLYADLGGVDLETILLHELGHSLGLGHVGGFADAPGDPVMSTFSNQVFRTLGEDDIAGIRQLYSFNGEDWSNGDPGTGGPGTDPGAPIPEPSAMLLFATGGLVGIGYSRRMSS